MDGTIIVFNQAKFENLFQYDYKSQVLAEEKAKEYTFGGYIAKTINERREKRNAEKAEKEAAEKETGRYLAERRSAPSASRAGGSPRERAIS